MEDGRGFFEGFLVDRIKDILIGCAIGGGAYFLGHWGMAYYASINNTVAVVSRIWDVFGVADGLFFAMTVVNRIVQWIRKLA
jgi:hypothetical protein